MSPLCFYFVFSLLVVAASSIEEPPKHVPVSIQVYQVSFPPTTTEWSLDNSTTEPAPEHRSKRSPSTGQVLANSQFACNGLIDGHYADVQYDCKYFHHCSFFRDSEGTLFVRQTLFQCGEGTKFNQTTRTCDYDLNVECHPGLVQKIIQDQLTAPTPLPGYGSSVQLPKTAFRCNEPSMQGYYYADVEDGCRMYHRCVYHVEVKEQRIYATQYSFLCPIGTLFDQSTISCQDKEQVKECHDSPSLVSAQASLHPINGLRPF